MSYPALRSLLGYRGMLPLQDLPTSPTTQVNVLTVASEAPSYLTCSSSVTSSKACFRRRYLLSLLPGTLSTGPPKAHSHLAFRPLCSEAPPLHHTQPTPMAPFYFSADIRIYLLLYLLLFSLFQNEHSIREGALFLFLEISSKPRLKPGRYQEFNKHPWKESIVWPDSFLLLIGWLNFSHVRTDSSEHRARDCSPQQTGGLPA